MFAPRAGRPLVAVGLVLLGAGLGEASRTLPYSLVGTAVLVVAAGLWGFFAWFFRDPERTPGDGVVSAADGRVREVREVEGDLLVSVFMNVTDVHVNRAPVAGRFARIGDAGAGHRAAYRPDAGRNVARTYEMTTELGTVRVVQITGVLARRLVSFVVPGTERAKGERFGMIVLGSRVDVFLPRDRVRATVRVGDRVRAGRTTIARVLA